MHVLTQAFQMQLIKRGMMQSDATSATQNFATKSTPKRFGSLQSDQQHYLWALEDLISWSQKDEVHQYLELYQTLLVPNTTKPKRQVLCCLGKGH